MRKLNIVFVLGKGSIALSGGFRIVAGYADRLCQRGHQVTLLAPGGGAGSPIEALRKKVRSWFAQPSSAPERPFLQKSDVKIEIVAGKEKLSSEDIPDADIVVATWWETAEWVSAKAGNLSKFHLVQDHEIFPYLPVERARAAHRLPLRKIVVSKWLEMQLAEQYDIDDAILIENAIDYERFSGSVRQKAEKPVVGFAYSGAARKNSARAIEACIALKQRMPELRVLAFGSRAVKKTDSMPDWVEFSLTPSEDEIIEIYRSCTAWLFASDEEGFGLPILEAMACGTPVVATPAGAAPEIVTSENGALVERSVAEISEAALHILKMTPDEWGKMSAKSVETARRRNWTQATNDLEMAFCEAFKAQNGGIY